jgi:hypothetical protein
VRDGMNRGKECRLSCMLALMIAVVMVPVQLLQQTGMLANWHA